MGEAVNLVEGGMYDYRPYVNKANCQLNSDKRSKSPGVYDELVWVGNR